MKKNKKGRRKEEEMKERRNFYERKMCENMVRIVERELIEGHEGDTEEERNSPPYVAFLCVVKTQQRRSKFFYKTELTKIRYKIK